MTLHFHLGRSGLRPIGWRRRSSLLSNLFRLDGTPTILAAGVMPSMSPGDTVANTVFPPGAWLPPPRRIKNVTFRNVPFSRSEDRRVGKRGVRSGRYGGGRND